MGIYFRKSIRVGPLRFNLSKSGIGVSAGIPGFRVGTGPRGNYVHMGVNGIYYRATLPSTSTKSSHPRPSKVLEQPLSHAPLEQIGSAAASQMIDSSSADLLSELNQKNKRSRTWPYASVIATIVAFTVVALHASPWIIGLVAILAAAGVFCAYQYDLLSKTLVIFYDLDQSIEDTYGRVHDSILQLARCGGSWHVDARGNVYEPKYHAGASQLVTRRSIAIATGQPPYVKTNLSIPFIPLSTRTLYFFPERILVLDSHGFGAVSYNDLSIVISTQKFIEENAVPHDARVIDHTWRYVNKNGTPDRRFNDNRQVPICLYEELWLNSPTGLNEIIQLSRIGLGEQLDAAVQSLSDLVVRSAAMPMHVLQSSVPNENASNNSPHAVNWEQSFQRPPNTDTQSTTYLFYVLLDVLCCLMIADGRASGSEKRQIRELMSKVRSPWTDIEVDGQIEAFIDRVQRDGYRRTLAFALSKVEVFKHVGKQHVLLQCLDAVARADEKIGIRELQLCQRVKSIVE